VLTYDSYQLLGDNEYKEYEQFINKYLPLESFMPWTQASFPQSGLSMLTQPIGMHPRKQVRINHLIWPTGMSRFGYAHVLCDSDSLKKIIADAYNSDGSYNPLDFVIGNTETNQSGTIVKGEQITTKMYMLPPSPQSGIRSLSGQTQSLYLLTLVDSRYLYWFKNAGEIDFFMTGNPTWQNLYDYLFNQCLGISMENYTIDNISESYLSPSQVMFSLPYEPVPSIIDAVAANIGHRVIAALNGTNYATQRYNIALMLLNQDMANNPNRVVLAGGQRLGQTL